MKTLPRYFLLIVLALTACGPVAQSSTPLPPTTPPPVVTVIPATPQPDQNTAGPKFVVKPPPMVTIPLPLQTIDPNAPSPTPRLYDGFVIAGDVIDSVRKQFTQSGFSVVDVDISFCVFPDQHLVQAIAGYGISSVEYSLDGSETENLVLWATINDYSLNTSTIFPFAYVTKVKTDGSICLAFVEVIKSQPTG